MPAGNTWSGYRNGAVSWCMHGVGGADSSYLKPSLFSPPCASFIYPPCAHFICHARVGALSFHRPGFWPEQACIEATHVASLVADVEHSQPKRSPVCLYMCHAGVGTLSILVLVRAGLH